MNCIWIAQLNLYLYDQRGTIRSVSLHSRTRNLVVLQQERKVYLRYFAKTLFTASTTEFRFLLVEFPHSRPRTAANAICLHKFWAYFSDELQTFIVYLKHKLWGLTSVTQWQGYIKFTALKGPCLSRKRRDFLRANKGSSLFFPRHILWTLKTASLNEITTVDNLSYANNAVLPVYVNFAAYPIAVLH